MLPSIDMIIWIFSILYPGYGIRHCVIYGSSSIRELELGSALDSDLGKKNRKLARVRTRIH